MSENYSKINNNEENIEDQYEDDELDQNLQVWILKYTTSYKSLFSKGSLSKLQLKLGYLKNYKSWNRYYECKAWVNKQFLFGYVCLRVACCDRISRATQLFLFSWKHVMFDFYLTLL